MNFFLNKTTEEKKQTKQENSIENAQKISIEKMKKKEDYFKKNEKDFIMTDLNERNILHRAALNQNEQSILEIILDYKVYLSKTKNLSEVNVKKKIVRK